VFYGIDGNELVAWSLPRALLRRVSAVASRGVKGMIRFRKVARVDDVPEGRGVAFEIEGKRIALFNIEGQFFAVEATCSQHGAPLNKGVIYEGTLCCPWHGVAFDVARGVCMAFPTERSAARYDVKVEEGDILLAL